MTDDRAEWHRTLRDGRRKSTAAHLQHIPAKELHEVGSVAADVCKRAGAWSPFISPAHRPHWIARVVAPIPPAGMHDATQSAGIDELAERGRARRPAEGEADADHRVSVPSDVGHGVGVREVVAQRL